MADYSFFIKDARGEIGYAEIYQNEEGLCVSSLFQNRIDLKKRYEDAIEEIYEKSKCYLKEDHSLLDSINSILDFWLMPSIDSIPVINEVYSSETVPFNTIREMGTGEYLIFEEKF
jgi:hypothetical protein